MPGYWVRKLTITEEFRIHSFNGRSIRAGHKVLRDGWTPETASSWVRSYDAGWKVDYTGFQSTQAQRRLAHRAVRALGLTFGAVDLGINVDGDLFVFEVNRAPGLEGGSFDAYVKHLKKLLQEQQGQQGQATPAPAPQ